MRRTSPKGTTRLRAARPTPRRRAWQCAFCPQRNEAGTTKCSGCGIKRGKKASSWEADARKLHQQVVRPAGTACCVCGTLNDVQDAHVFGRGANPSPAVKWHPDNGIPACGAGGMNCHYKFDSYQLGDRGEIAVRFMGQARYAALQEAAKQRWDRDWPGVIRRLRDRLAQREEGSAA